LSAAAPAGSLPLALAHAQRLLARDARLAIEQAGEILKVYPDQPDALLVLGLAQGAAGQGDAAVATLRRAVSVQPELAEAWRALADHLMLAEETAEANAAYARHVQASTRDPRLLRPAAALAENRLPEAETLLRDQLRLFPTDVVAMRMLAEVAARLGRHGDAVRLLERALELAPEFTAARHNYAQVLYRQQRPAEALQEVAALLARVPGHPAYRSLKAALLAGIGDYAASLPIYAQLLLEYPSQPRLWMSYGHALKSAGQQPAGIAAYRRSIALRPGLGEAYWSLANLKTFGFQPDEVLAMQAQLARSDLTPEDRFHLHFALGKALEDQGDYAASFAHYAEGNRLRRAGISYEAADTSAHLASCRQLFTREFFAARAGWGASSPDPIFIVGLPRSGSTLVEQILASHPQVEGTMELPDIMALVRSLGEPGRRNAGPRYPEVLASLDARAVRALGERYLETTRIQRHGAAPFFIDKMPNNFAHLGLIQLALPRARIIDVRRHPMACCFSGYKQHFARGQNFSYDLAEIGRYYRDYVALMASFDAALPGRIHRVIYEQLVADTETEIRRLLDYCGLPFDEHCLRFHENGRPVRTASSEQVRRPIFRDAIDHWQRYEPWLEPLRSALGDVLEYYPAVPHP
jgi:tetratricopeptide (TPR) repeat protein